MIKMDATNLLTLASSLVAALFGILSVVIGWVGSRVIVKQDEMMEKIDDFRTDLHDVKYELNDRISQIDIRLVRVETLLDDN